jgi:spermidine synthase
MITRRVASSRASEAARSYVFSRLMSARYLVPALTIPLLSAFAIARAGTAGLLGVVALQFGLAVRYRSCWTKPGTLGDVLLPAAIGGLFCALERAALGGPEWRHGGRLLFAEQSPLQRVVLAERNGGLELYVDGELQFRAADEHLYHRALLEPALGLLPHRAHVMIMGGGDGLAARDLLRSERVGRITIVDWDRTVTRLFRDDPSLRVLNHDALRDPRVRVVHSDVRSLLARPGEPFDLVVGDLTDPHPDDPSSRALCSSTFYEAIRTRLVARGALVTHASSLDGAWAARAIPEALERAGFITSSYSCVVPSFECVTYVLGVLPEPAHAARKA